MDHYFAGDYIKVLKPITVDGLNIQMDDDMRGQFKEIHLPITALNDLNLQNAKLPKAQQMRIQVIRQYEQITKPASKQKAPEPVVEEDETPAQPAKRGPKPKQHDLD